jgi:hypothetical protein
MFVPASIYCGEFSPVFEAVVATGTRMPILSSAYGPLSFLPLTTNGNVYARLLTLAVPS